MTIHDLAGEFDRLFVRPRRDLHNGAVTRFIHHSFSDGSDRPDRTDRIEWSREWKDIDDRSEFDWHDPISRGTLLTIDGAEITKAVEALRQLATARDLAEAFAALDAAGVRYRSVVERDKYERAFARKAD